MEHFAAETNSFNFNFCDPVTLNLTDHTSLVLTKNLVIISSDGERMVVLMKTTKNLDEFRLIFHLKFLFAYFVMETLNLKLFKLTRRKLKDSMSV